MELNESGRLIFEALLGGASHREILALLADTYDLTGREAEALRDLAGLTDLLADGGYVPTTSRVPLLRELFLAVTDHCNLGCAYCNTWSSRHKAELTVLQLTTILERFALYPLEALTVSGGEPLLHRDFPAMLAALEAAAVPWSLNTNGTLLDPRRIGLLAECRNLSGLLIGLDQIEGSSAGLKTHSKELDLGLERLCAAAPHLSVRFFTVVTRENLEHLEPLVRYASEHGIAAVQLEPLLPVGRGEQSSSTLALDQKAWRRSFDLAAALKERWGDLVQGNLVSMGRHFAALASADPPTGPGTFRVCSAGTTKLAVRPDGGLIPCDRLWDLVVGNVFEEHLLDVVERSAALRDLRERSTVKLADREPGCSRCPVLPCCGGGCPAPGWYAHGSLHRLDLQSCLHYYQEGQR